MKNFLVRHRSVVIATAVAWLPVPLLHADGQQRPAAPKAAPAKPAADKSATIIKRTPDGQPDIHGTWTKEGGQLNEKNPPGDEIPLLSKKLRQGALGSIGEEPAGFTGGADGRGTSGE